MKRDALYFALNETTHALRFIESAAKRFRTDPDELETGSGLASSVAYITNRCPMPGSPLLPQKQKSAEFFSRPRTSSNS
jgi:hypothetical protein